MLTTFHFKIMFLFSCSVKYRILGSITAMMISKILPNTVSLAQRAWSTLLVAKYRERWGRSASACSVREVGRLLDGSKRGSSEKRSRSICSLF